MSVSFPFEVRSSAIFGKVFRPVALVSFWSKMLNNWTEIPMIVDTGADYTLLPRYQIKNLGIDVERDCHTFETEGIGGSELVYVVPKHKIRLGEKEFSAPVGFLDRDNVPPLLGRQALLENIRVIFDNHKTIFELDTPMRKS